MRDDVTPVLISCQQRHTARSLTLPQLHAAGVFPRVFLDECTPRTDRKQLFPNDLGNKWIGMQAIEWAIPLGRPVLLLEDDIDLAPDFNQGLDAALATGEVTYLYTNETPERLVDLYGPEHATRLLDGTPTPLQATPARTLTGLFGTQAVLIPHHAALLTRRYFHKTRKAIDAVLWHTLEGERLPARVITPNVVQHRHDRTAREPEAYEKRSLSYHCPRGSP